ncbi:MAG: 4Fe-4S dicluster domain-containing protein [Phycisphaerae bacterium]
MTEPELTITSRSQLAEAVFSESGQNVNLCYQCRKCSAGCPISYSMDYKPAQLIHAIRLGMDDLVFKSKTMWLCASCETCTTRCPQEVDVAKVMDAVKIIARRQRIKPTIPQIASFYRAALSNIKKCGRMYEMGMIVGLKMRTFEFFKDAGLGMKMFRKGKLKMIPSLTGALRTWKIFNRVRSVENLSRLGSAKRATAERNRNA